MTARKGEKGLSRKQSGTQKKSVSGADIARTPILGGTARSNYGTYPEGKRNNRKGSPEQNGGRGVKAKKG